MAALSLTFSHREAVAIKIAGMVSLGSDPSDDKRPRRDNAAVAGISRFRNKSRGEELYARTMIQRSSKFAVPSRFHFQSARSFSFWHNEVFSFLGSMNKSSWTQVKVRGLSKSLCKIVQYGADNQDKSFQVPRRPELSKSSQKLLSSQCNRSLQRT